MSDLRTRIAAAIESGDDWRGVTDATILADAVIAELGLRMQYENSRVMYDHKPPACKPNGLWQQRIVSDHEPYTE